MTSDTKPHPNAATLSATTRLFRQAARAAERAGLASSSDSASAGQNVERGELDAFVSRTTELYAGLQHKAHALAHSPGAATDMLARLVAHSALAPGVRETSADGIRAIASLLASSVAPIGSLPDVVLVARIDGGQIRVYEAYDPDIHPMSARTVIGRISEEWVVCRHDNDTTTIDIYQQLEYRYSRPSDDVVVELTWVGTERPTVSAGTRGAAWSVSNLPPDDPDVIGTVHRSPPMSPRAGVVAFTLHVQTGTLTFDSEVCLQTSRDATPSGPIIVPTPIRERPVGPTPSSLPKDFTTLQPIDVLQTLYDDVAWFVRDTLQRYEKMVVRELDARTRLEQPG